MSDPHGMLINSFQKTDGYIWSRVKHAEFAPL